MSSREQELGFVNHDKLGSGNACCLWEITYANPNRDASSYRDADGYTHRDADGDSGFHVDASANCFTHFTG